MNIRMNGWDRSYTPTQTSIKVKVKDEHPEWLMGKLVDVGWQEYIWNYENKGPRDLKVAALTEVVENYDLDGVELDYSRAAPFLPPGSAWEKRDYLTSMMRDVRESLQNVAKKRGRPVLISTRVPSTIPGCHYDGIDIEEWVRQNLIDMITVGSRAIGMEISEFKQMIGDKPIRLHASLDGGDPYHGPSGYETVPVEVYRGIAANLLSQGADGIYLINWYFCSSVEKSKKAWGYLLNANKTGVESQTQAIQEFGRLETMHLKDKIFPVGRRWGGGVFNIWQFFVNTNAFEPLPIELPGGKFPAQVYARVADNLAELQEYIKSVELRIQFSGPAKEQKIETKINGTDAKNFEIKDGGWYIYNTRPMQYAVGKNMISVRLPEPEKIDGEKISIEKVEVHVDYK